jgi:hypothetical protein
MTILKASSVPLPPSPIIADFDLPTAFRVFQAEVLACPQEDALEALAESLGAPRISKLVTENYRTLGEPDQGSKRAVDLHRSELPSHPLAEALADRLARDSCC